jgi:hypothetical protein
MANTFWNREKLYEQVWNEPVTKVAQRYGVSDVAIAKVCRKMTIPVPGRGYWAKKAHGYPVARKPLPGLKDVPAVARASVAEHPLQSRPSFPAEAADLAEILRIEQLLLSGAFIPQAGKGLRNKLLTGTRRALRNGFKDTWGILHAARGEICLDLRVSKSALSRALELMGMLIAVFESQGLTVAVVPSNDKRSETRVKILGQTVQFGIIEKVREVPLEPQADQRSLRYKPTGQLSIQVLSCTDFYKKIWRDKETKPVEALIPECVATMMKIGVEHRREAEKSRQEEVFRKMHEQELARLGLMIKGEEARVQRLEEGARNWARAKRIREYVLALADRRTKEGHQLNPGSALGKWVAWALQQADRLDPLADSPWSILDRKGELPEAREYGWK